MRARFSRRGRCLFLISIVFFSTGSRGRSGRSAAHGINGAEFRPLPAAERNGRSGADPCAAATTIAAAGDTAVSQTALTNRPPVAGIHPVQKQSSVCCLIRRIPILWTPGHGAGRCGRYFLWAPGGRLCRHARPAMGGGRFYRKYRTAERNSPISYVPGTFRYSPLPMRSEWPILPSTRPSGEVMPSMA